VLQDVKEIGALLNRFVGKNFNCIFKLYINFNCLILCFILLFQQIHTKKRNKLSQQRLSALVFVKYNNQLKLREEKRKSQQHEDVICLSDIESDDEWIAEKEEPLLPEDTSWMDMEEIFLEQREEYSESQQQTTIPSM